jgi:hypothetical protein
MKSYLQPSRGQDSVFKGQIAYGIPAVGAVLPLFADHLAPALSIPTAIDYRVDDKASVPLSILQVGLGECFAAKSLP